MTYTKNHMIFCCFLMLATAGAIPQKPIGLTNVANSCFINGILQALLVTPYFETLAHLKDRCPTFLQACVTVDATVPAFIDELVLFSKSYHTLADSASMQAYDTDALYQALLNKYQLPLNIEEGQQGDADEVLTAFITKIQNVIDKIGDNNRKLCKASPFHYAILQRFTCIDCHKDRTNNIPTNTFVTASPGPNGIVDIATTIREFSKAEFLPESICYNCQSEKHISNPRNRVQRIGQWITELPETLAFTINTVQINPLHERINTCIVPSMIDASLFLEHAPRDRRIIYRLAAIVLHEGGELGGHYTAYVKYSNNWFYCDDSRVVPATRNIHTWTDNIQPRMLFYIKEKPADAIEDLQDQLALLTAAAARIEPAAY